LGDTIKRKRGILMEWNYEESLKGIEKASVENWKALQDGG